MPQTDEPWEFLSAVQGCVAVSLCVRGLQKLEALKFRDASRHETIRAGYELERACSGRSKQRINVGYVPY